MSEILCVECHDPTVEVPDHLPRAWAGHCPHCVLIKIADGRLPQPTGEQMAVILQNVITVLGDDSVKVIVERVGALNEAPYEMEPAVSGTGQIFKHHPKEACETVDSPCAIHSPSDHHMVSWPIHLRSDLEFPLIERICPHNATHPDPDALGFIQTHHAEFDPHHGACDGCCQPNA